MKFEELWENYLNQDITEISDEIIAVFREPLAPKIREEYDIGEMIIEFTGHHETAKQYDKIEELRRVLKIHQEELYEEDGDYLNESLIEYYCFREDLGKIKENLIDFIEREYDYDLLIKSIKQIQYYGYSEIIDKLIEKEFTKVRDSAKLIDGAEFELAKFKYHIELEKLFKSPEGKDSYDWIEFGKRISPYGFKFNEEYLAALETGLLKKGIADEGLDLLKDFPKEKTYIMGTLEMMFLKYMDQKGCCFPISGVIWYELFQYFENKKERNWPNYFKIGKKDYEQFLSSKSGFISDNTIDIVLILWGSSYLLDFIKKLGVINEEQYLAQKELVKKVMLKFREENRYYLWKYSFVHEWERYEGEELAERELAEKEFKASYDLPIESEELDMLKFDSLFKEPLRTSPKEGIYQRLIKPERKIGRNEKVTVKYSNGIVKKEIKYKHILKDLEEGKCEIV